MYTCRYEKQGAPFLELKKRTESLNKIQRKGKKGKRVPNTCSRYWIFVYYIPRNLLWEVFVDFFQPAVSQPILI